eukprot:1262167-Rhodomonas_salina.1
MSLSMIQLVEEARGIGRETYDSDFASREAQSFFFSESDRSKVKCKVKRNQISPCLSATALLAPRPCSTIQHLSPGLRHDSTGHIVAPYATAVPRIA